MAFNLVEDLTSNNENVDDVINSHFTSRSGSRAKKPVVRYGSNETEAVHKSTSNPSSTGRTSVVPSKTSSAELIGASVTPTHEKHKNGRGTAVVLTLVIRSKY